MNPSSDCERAGAGWNADAPFKEPSASKLAPTLQVKKGGQLVLAAFSWRNYLPVFTNWMQSPWFLNAFGVLKVFQPPFLH